VHMGSHDLVVSHTLLEKTKSAKVHLKYFDINACSMGNTQKEI